MPKSLRLMFTAAASVKVRAKIFSGAVSVLSKIFAMRKVSTCVFPVPGPATTITGPSIVSTAFFCSGFSLAYSFLNCGEIIKQYYHITLKQWVFRIFTFTLALFYEVCYNIRQGDYMIVNFFRFLLDGWDETQLSVLRGRIVRLLRIMRRDPTLSSREGGHRGRGWSLLRCHPTDCCAFAGAPTPSYNSNLVWRFLWLVRLCSGARATFLFDFCFFEAYTYLRSRVPRPVCPSHGNWISGCSCQRGVSKRCGKSTRGSPGGQATRFIFIKNAVGV